jgi:threonine dehydrogenase-like Zn-dependent dehydrogenase
MLGVCIGRSGSVEHREFPEPKLKNGHVRLRVHLAGICATDLQLLAGYKVAHSSSGMILGHEFIGTIDAIHGSEAGGEYAVGDRVVSEINCLGPGVHSCGGWRERAQDPARTALGIFGADGCFADFVCVPIKNLHKVPDSVPDTDAVFTEPLAAACSILEEVRIRATDKIAVLGAGRLGTLIAGVLSAGLFDVTVLVKDPARAAHVEKVAAERHVPIVDVASVGKDAFDCVVDATGHPLGFQRALEVCKPRGTVVLKSTYAPGNRQQTEIDMSLIVVKELHVVGSRCGPFSTALRLLEERRVWPSFLIDSTFALANVREAFAVAATHGRLKILLRPGR